MNCDHSSRDGRRDNTDGTDKRRSSRVRQGRCGQEGIEARRERSREDWRNDQGGMQRRTEPGEKTLGNEEIDDSRKHTGRQHGDGWRKAVMQTADTKCQRAEDRSRYKETGTAASDDDADRERVGA